ncbi:MAG: pentapeptide repeat-containing protein [Crocosphaera sp.]|nr:pentapeptide repeat-containing protein [Crocosphaera sp.]
MTNFNEIEATKPKNILEREINLDLKSFLLTVGKGAVNIAFLQWDDLAENGVEILESLGLENKPEEIAGLLIIRGLTNAIKKLIKSNKDLFIEEPGNPKELFKSLSDALTNHPITISDRFFTYPKELPLITEVKTGFFNWLKPLIENEKEAESISHRLPEYFVYALTEEWQNNKEDYLILIEQLDTPFTQANKREQGWYKYRAWLQQQIQEPVFWEAFSLKQIYIPLRAFYEENNYSSGSSSRKHQIDETLLQEKEKKCIVSKLFELLESWVKEANKDDAIRLLTGGPGSGKSSFTKMFAASLAEKNEIPVLYIPLHRFNLSDDLIKAVGEFVQFDGFLSENPLDPNNNELRLLIIFDGLDELSKQGKIAEEVAREFVEEVRDKVREFNIHKTRLQVLISGREVVIQAHRSKFRQDKQLLYLCPYIVSNEDKRKHKYVDLENLLDEDQRDDWWKCYGELKGKDYQGLPDVLKRDNLKEITAQPLLNYLIALSYGRNHITFTEETNLNEIYQDLLAAVYERGYEQQGHLIIEGIKQKEFIAILEEIALACWHGDGRTTTVKEIETHCDRSGLQELLIRFQDCFQSDSRASITRLLAAFYFRESGQIRESEKTFEFTHKSFGEYLTALRIVETLTLINDELARKKKTLRQGWDEKRALLEWIQVFGQSGMDIHLFHFIVDEMRLREIETVQQWQEMLCHLIEFMLINGMPMEGLTPRPSFQEEMRQSRNAEEALLVVLNACAKVTENRSNVKWPTPESFGEWIGRLLGQRKDFEPVFVMQYLSFLDLQDCNLLLRDFYLANLERANLERADLLKANLERANLERTNLERTNLERANLERANLERANLVGANLVGADLYRADLDGANLQGANLQGAENITPKQIKQARNWELADYDPEFREALGLSVEDTE